MAVYIGKGKAGLFDVGNELENVAFYGGDYGIDVYKRQAYNSASNGYVFDGASQIMGMVAPGVVTDRLSWVTSSISNVGPVSYTHLDVYKRQVRYFPYDVLPFVGIDSLEVLSFKASGSRHDFLPFIV